ncbi:WD40 repeat domain-containing protein [Streptosporangium sandarakinum]
MDGNATFPLVSRDGRRIAYTLDGQGAMVWHDLRPADRDIAGPAHRLPGAELRTFMLGGQSGALSIVAFSPRADQIATVDADGRLRLWGLSRQTLRTLPQHLPRMRQVWFGADENTFVAELRSDTGMPQSSDRSAASLDLRTGKVRELEELRGGISKQRLEEVAVSGDGRVLITCHTLGTGKTVYRAVLVADGRQLAHYTSDNASCFRSAVDSTGERFAVFGGASTWVLVSTRPDIQPQRFFGRNPGGLVLSPLPGDARDPIMVHRDENMVTGWRMFSDDRQMIYSLPRLLDHGRMMMARMGPRRYIGTQPDTLKVIETEDQKRTLAEVPIDAATPPNEYQVLAVNAAETLVADVVDHNRIVIRDLPRLREVAEVTTRMPPVGKDGNRELVDYFFLNDREVVTASGGVLEHWNARDGRRLSEPLNVRDPRIDGMDLAGYYPKRHPEPGYVQIAGHGDHILRAISLRTRKENTDLQIHLGGDTDTALLSRRGDTALTKTRGGMVEFWSVQDRRRPTKVLGSVGVLQRPLGWKIGVWEESGFFLASMDSVKFVNLTDPDRAGIESYDFADKQAFLASADDGKSLLLTNALYGGIVELFRLDPDLWQRHLCAVLGRDMDNADRQSLPPDLPDVICPPR